MADRPKIHLSVFKNARHNRPTLSKEFEWEEIVANLLSLKVVSAKDEAPLLSFVRFKEKRGNDTVELCTAVVVDIDCGVPYNSVKSKIDHLEHVAYSTYSNSEEKQKYRLIFPLATPVSTAAEYTTHWQQLNILLGSIGDEQAKDAARISYWHSCAPDKRDVAFSVYHKGDFFTNQLDIIKDWDKLKPKEREISLEKGFPDGQRTQALVERVGLLLGPAFNYTAEETITALKKWNLLNSPPLPDEKIESTVASIAKRESGKRDVSVSELPGLPLGYRWNAAGRLTTDVPVKGEDGEETLETVEITEFPLYLLSVTRKEREFRQAYIFMQFIPKEGWREFQVSCSDFESSSWKTFMAACGGHCILNDKLFKNYVHKADSELRRKQMDSVRYQQFGWKDEAEAFLIGDTLISKGGKVDRVYGGEEISYRMKQMEPKKGGSLHAWTQEANLLFSDQYIHLGYALVASFATPLLKFCMGESDGGFVLSITSPGSGKGKTRTIEACTSIWGELESLQITPRDTLNAQMSIVTAAGNLPVFMDEWNEKDAGIQAKFLRQLTVGHDKNRAQRDGTVKSKPASYKTLLITTSNHSIRDIMDMINDEAAAARVVEIVAPDLDGEVFKKFDKITGRMLANSGYAGREFIYQLMQPGVMDKVRVDLTVAVDKIREHLKTEGKHRYITVLPAAILVTANLLVKYGILEFDVARLIKWSFKHVSNRVQAVQTLSATEILGRFFTENQSKILMVSEPCRGGIPVMVLNNMGNIPSTIIARAERLTNRLYLMPYSFKLWCVKNNYDLRRVIKELEEERILLDQHRVITIAAGTVAASTFGRVTCWEMDTTFTPDDAIVDETPS